PVHTAVWRWRGEGARVLLVGVQGEVHATTGAPGWHRPMPSQAPGSWHRSPSEHDTPWSTSAVAHTPRLQVSRVQGFRSSQSASALHPRTPVMPWGTSNAARSQPARARTRETKRAALRIYTRLHKIAEQFKKPLSW